MELVYIIMLYAVFDPTVTPSSGNEGECHYNQDDTSIRSRVDVCPQQEGNYYNESHRMMYKFINRMMYL